MANYYVSNVRGNDSTGDGLTGTTPWKTIGKAIGASPGITLSGSGDELFIEPGVYREVVPLGLSPTMSGPLTITGDTTGAGFLAGGYSTPVAGVVDWRGWSDSTTGLTANSTLYATGKSYVTLQGVQIMGANVATGAGLYVTGTWSDWTVQDCIFLAYATRASTLWFDCTAGAAANLAVKRTTVFGSYTSGIACEVRIPTHTSEYALNILFQNYETYGGCYGVRFYTTGANSFLGTGITAQNCASYGGNVHLSFYSNSAIVPTTKAVVRGSYALFCGTGLGANNVNQVDADYNDLFCSAPYSGVTPGANSRTVLEPAVNLGSERLFGGVPRPFMEPLAGAPQLGFVSAGSPPSVDIMNRPRPAGGAIYAASGARERHYTVAKETITTDAGSVGWSITGRGDDFIEVAVDDSATTITLKARYDANHGATNKPYITMRANPEIGVATATATMTAAVDTWETLTIGPFTPTAKGVVVVDLYSRAAASTGKAFFDTGAIS